MVKKYRVIGRQSTEIWDFDVVNMGRYYCVLGIVSVNIVL
jgi:hypothetical protein